MREKEKPWVPEEPIFTRTDFSDTDGGAQLDYIRDMPVKLRNRLSQMYDPNEENVRPHFVLRLELALDYKLAYAEQIKDQRLCKGQHLKRNTGTSEWMCHKALTGQCFSARP